MAVELVDGYRWVLTVVIANIILNAWMGIMVGKARRRFNVPYPDMYANDKDNKDAKTFNGVQRGHQNSMEFLPAFITVVLLGGLQYPLVSATLGAVYTVARIQYFRGYSTGEAAKRFSGAANVMIPAFFGILFCAIGFTLHQFFPDFV